MLLRSPPPLSSSATTCNALKNSGASSLQRNAGGRFVMNASKETNRRMIMDVVFEPFEEVKKELLLVPTMPQASLALQKFSNQSEAAINQQINVEYNVSYVYHAMYDYFDRDNVALKGLANIEEWQHAEKFMEYQVLAKLQSLSMTSIKFQVPKNKRGGKVKLQSMLMPVSDFEHIEKGDALYVMELTLSLEKLTNEKLLNLHKVATQNNDVQLVDFVEGEFLVEQVEAIKKISEHVAQLRRVGKGHGIWDFDQMLLKNEVAA